MKTTDQHFSNFANRNRTRGAFTIPTFLIAFFFSTFPCDAVRVSRFDDIDRYVEDPKRIDIVIAKCENKDTVTLDFEIFTTDVRHVISGNRPIGKLTVASTEPLKPGTLYMLRSGKGGQVNGVDFIAIGQNLSVVPLPGDFDVSLLEGKDAKQQVLEVFSRRQYEIERELNPIICEKSLLENALADRSDNVFNSEAPVHLNLITDFVINAEEKGIPIDGKELHWSGSKPGKTGYLYFGPWGNEKPIWEFATTTFHSMDELEGKRVEAVFYGRYTPGRPDANRGPDAIFVNVGDVVLLRATSNPSTVYVLDLVSQENTEILHGKYATLSN